MVIVVFPPFFPSYQKKISLGVGKRGRSQQLCTRPCQEFDLRCYFFIGGKETRTARTTPTLTKPARRENQSTSKENSEEININREATLFWHP